jgi:Rps23 Pro-64 3,4-dihydroxylase Tpa1-like proline 4-hydroxylase
LRAYIKDYKEFELDRCQSHVYDPGSYLERHNDSRHSANNYAYSVLIGLSKEKYEGGTLNVYDHENNVYPINVYCRDIFLLNMLYDHEVTKVTKGVRKVLAIFVEGKN